MINDLKTFTNIFKTYYKNSPPNNAKLMDYFNITYSKYSLQNLHKLQKIKVTKFTKIVNYLKEFVGSAKALGFQLANNYNIDKFDKLVVTTGRCSDISSTGVYHDKYFNESSKDHPGILWFVINLDNRVPRKIDKNVLFFTNNSNKFVFIKNFIFLIVKKIFFFLWDKNKFFYLEILSEEIWKNIYNSINTAKIKTIVTPYEGQPFQNYLYYKLKKLNKKIKTIGYVHATQGLPIHLFKRDGAPELLYVHGSDQKYHLTKFFGWNKKLVKNIPSLKIRAKNKQKYQNTIFLPFYIENKKFYLKNFEQLIKILKKKLPNNLKIKIHPQKLSDKKHIDFKKSLSLILKKFKLNKKIKYCGPIIIGPASIVLEVLENKLEVYQIHKNILLDGYSSYYWPNINVRAIKKNSISHYKIRKINTCINISSKKNIDFLKY
jgi:hypothetical protein